MFLKKSKAVSYIEVMLVLVIIGTVSALTIPSMKRHSQRHELGALAQKSYMVLNDALDNAILQHGPSRNWVKSTNVNIFRDYFRPSLQIIDEYADGSYYYLTKDGMAISVFASGPEYIEIRVDVNGNNKGPNKAGKDIHCFKFYMQDSKIEPSSPATIELYKNNWKFTDELWYK